MSRIFTPSNNISLQNIAVCRLKRSGKRFELACYKNKLGDWRSGVEKDLHNVIQSDTIFSNVAKGQVASATDLAKAFGKTTPTHDCILEILKKGDVQVGERERTQQMQVISRDIATIVSEKCVNPGKLLSLSNNNNNNNNNNDADTLKPYTVSMIEKDMHFSSSPRHSAKQQALDVIKQIQASGIIPLERAKLKIRIVVSGSAAKRVKEYLHGLANEAPKEADANGAQGDVRLQVLEDDWLDEEYECTCIVEPGELKQISDHVSRESKGKGRVDMLGSFV
ncbi:MAG: hypothetical protein SGCHY_000600 [Lobulomycetales sp.]